MLHVTDGERSGGTWNYAWASIAGIAFSVDESVSLDPLYELNFKFRNILSRDLSLPLPYSHPPLSPAAVLIPSTSGFPDGTDVASLLAATSDAGSFTAAMNSVDLTTLFPSSPSDTDGLDFTVFAPSNDAYAALPGYLGSNYTALWEILAFHILPGRIYSDSLAPGTSRVMMTHNGQTVTLSRDASGGVLTLAGAGNTTARVLAVDLDARNGVLFTIDAVLLPGGMPADDSAAGRAAPSWAAVAAAAVVVGAAAWWRE